MKKVISDPIPPFTTSQKSEGFRKPKKLFILKFYFKVLLVVSC